MAVLDDQGTEEITPSEQADLDQIEAGLREGDTGHDPNTDNQFGKGVRSGWRGRPGQIKGGFLKSNRKKLFAAGAGLGGLAGITVIFFLLLLFKNIHIKNLFLDYEYAKFNRAFRNRLEESVKEADANSGATADSTVEPTDTPVQALNEVDSTKIKELQNDITDDPQAFNDAAAQVESLDQDASVIGSSASGTDTEFGIDVALPDETGKPDDQVQQDTSTEIKDEISQGETAESPPTDSVKGAVDEAQTAIDNGATADAVAQAAGEGWAKSANSFLSEAAGPFFIATIGCIARDIFETGYKAVSQVKLAGLAKSATITNKYADCQKQGKCSLTQIGTVANQFDNSTQSFTQTAAYQRATGHTVGANTPDLDTNLRPDPNLANGISGEVGTALAVADNVNKFLTIKIPKTGITLGSGCSIILNPVGQLALVAANVTVAAVGVATDTVDFGASTVAQAAATSAAVIFGSKVGKALALDAALHYGGLLFKQNFNPIQKGNMQGAGDKALATDACARNGCRQLSPQENTQLALAIYSDQIKQDQHSSIAYRLFSPHNPTSTMGLLVDKMPSNPRAATAAIGQFFATLLSPPKLGKTFIGLINPIKPAWAADVEYQTYGIKDYGFTDSELNAWTVKANTAWVQANISPDQQAAFARCFDPNSVKLADLLNNNGSDAQNCNAWSADNEAFTHYRIYQLDSRVTKDLALLYNHQEGVGSTANQVATPGGPSSLSSGTGCANPFTDPGWIPGRTDQGVDYDTNSPLPVRSICNGTVLSLRTPGWPGVGAFIYIKNDSTAPVPAEVQGKCIYYAENINAQVSINQHVSAGQQIGVTVPGTPNTEWGWAQGPGTPATPAATKDHNDTPGGLAFTQFLRQLGAPTAETPPAGTPIYTGNTCP